MSIRHICDCCKRDIGRTLFAYKLVAPVSINDLEICRECFYRIRDEIINKNEMQKALVIKRGRGMSKEICGECKWHKYDEFGRAWVCTNDRSDYVADFTDYTDTCEEWEQRGKE